MPSPTATIPPAVRATRAAALACLLIVPLVIRKVKKTKAEVEAYERSKIAR